MGDNSFIGCTGMYCVSLHRRNTVPLASLWGSAVVRAVAMESGERLSASFEWGSALTLESGGVG